VLASESSNLLATGMTRDLGANRHRLDRTSLEPAPDGSTLLYTSPDAVLGWWRSGQFTGDRATTYEPTAGARVALKEDGYGNEPD
jgi:hypothetical protein